MSLRATGFFLLAVLAGASVADAALVGALYNEGHQDMLPASVAASLAMINGQSPTATFTSNLINSGATYGTVDGGSASALLGAIPGDQATLSSNYAPLGSSVMDLNGYMTITTAGIYTFTNNNDDGGAFWVGGTGAHGSGTQLATNDGLHGQQVVSSDFGLGVGTYRIEYLAYNASCDGCGYTGNADNTGGGADFVASITGPGPVSFSTVPEPGSLVLLGLGAIGLFAVARRRRG